MRLRPPMSLRHGRLRIDAPQDFGVGHEHQSRCWLHHEDCPQPALRFIGVSQPLIDIRNLTKHFQRGHQKIRAVDDVSLSIGIGEIVGLVGESGSGKSTLGRTLLGLDRKTSGEIFFKGSALPKVYRTGDFRRYARSMQMIFQDPYSSLNPRMTAGEIIGEALRLHSDFNKADIATRVEEWLVKVGLSIDLWGVDIPTNSPEANASGSGSHGR
ncbi:MAG: hypothetical protein Ct9H300mP8_00400 [Gammaproteobacteria bacterium]|nr:MAG: hypothetical protein Ct9H300mP8_00400 [Gammaproteobacteria bacterium]